MYGQLGLIRHPHERQQSHPRSAVKAPANASVSVRVASLSMPPLVRIEAEVDSTSKASLIAEMTVATPETKAFSFTLKTSP